MIGENTGATTGTAVEPTGVPTVLGDPIGTYVGFEPAVVAGAQFLAAIVLAGVVVGLAPGFGRRTILMCRRSPAISVCIGLPAVIVVGALTATGYVILGSSIGTAFGLPLVLGGLALLLVGTTVGVVAIGRTIAARLGRNGLGYGILVGGLLAGLAGVSPWGTVALVSLAAVIGTGACLRVLFGFGTTTGSNERVVPPANKV
ncbi:hypothetical protein ACFQGT_17300 [Natrialbaceae archaeon GCM10025810]|uniref:hypothetical protein n=1 Tax=Halovalidus salilacus TaxID=3075124 RepID=UPI00361850CD